MLQASTNSATRFGLIWDIGWFVGILPDSFRFFTTVYSITWLSCLHVDTSWLTKLGRLQVRQGIDRDSRGWDVSRSVEILLLFEILWSVLGYFEIVSSVSWYLGILKKKKTFTWNWSNYQEQIRNTWGVVGCFGMAKGNCLGFWGGSELIGIVLWDSVPGWWVRS